MQDKRYKPPDSGPDAGIAHGCWDMLVTLASRYPINSLGDLMRVTRLAEHAHSRGLLLTSESSGR